MKKILFPIFLALFIAGCATPGADRRQNLAQVESRDAVASVVADERLDARALPEVLRTGILAERSIYFDFDRYDIRPEHRGLITAHAQFLANNPQFRVLIQGNTDERGSREYNLALGQRRADAIQNMLILLGARAAQVEAVSLGEEKPRALGQNEAAWAENRRGDILYSGEF